MRLVEMPESNQDRVNMALKLLHDSGATAKQTAQAAVFFAASLDEVDPKKLWPLQNHGNSN